MSKLIKGDEVIVLTGKDKGRRGPILKIIDEQHILVENVNIVKRATKPNPNKNQIGGLVDKAQAIHVSNVAIFNPTTKKSDRVGFTFVEGKKQRIFRSDGQAIKAS